MYYTFLGRKVIIYHTVMKIDPICTIYEKTAEDALLMAQYEAMRQALLYTDLREPRTQVIVEQDGDIITHVQHILLDQEYYPEEIMLITACQVDDNLWEGVAWRHAQENIYYYDNAVLKELSDAEKAEIRDKMEELLGYSL